MASEEKVVPPAKRRAAYKKRLSGLLKKHAPEKLVDSGYIDDILNSHVGTEHQLYLTYVHTFNAEPLPEIGKDITVSDKDSANVPALLAAQTLESIQQLRDAKKKKSSFGTQLGGVAKRAVALEKEVNAESKDASTEDSETIDGTTDNQRRGSVEIKLTPPTSPKSPSKERPPRSPRGGKKKLKKSRKKRKSGGKKKKGAGVASKEAMDSVFAGMAGAARARGGRRNSTEKTMRLRIDDINDGEFEKKSAAIAQKTTRKSVLEMLRKGLVVDSLNPEKSLDSARTTAKELLKQSNMKTVEEHEAAGVKVAVRFRPDNIMEKKQEILLLFKTEFDMDDRDYSTFNRARKALLKKSEEGELEPELTMWTVENCCDWLDEIDLEPYKKRFRRRKVNGAWLKDIPSWSEKKPLEFERDSVVAFTRGDQSHEYEMDVVLSHLTTTHDSCFAAIGEPLIEDVLNGYNATIFAYGQTGTGKTHTMFGRDLKEQSTCEFTMEDVFADDEADEKESKDDSDDDDLDVETIGGADEETAESKALDVELSSAPSKEDAAAPDGDWEINLDDDEEDEYTISQPGDAANVMTGENEGIIPRCLRLLFERLKNDEDIAFWNVQVAFIEIYQEYLRDLIKPRLKLTLRYVGRDSQVDNLSWWDINTAEEALEYIEKSKRNRKTASTKQNLTSSRSHCIIQCKIELTLRDGTQQTTKLNFGDLAGSEKVTKTGAKGARLREAQKIVQSLFALKKVIRALSENKAFVPYQDSVLTKLLRDSLGGNSKTTIVVCCSPHAYNREETLSTLRFAEMAKKIQNDAVVNRLLSRNEMEGQLRRLQDELQYLRKQKAKGSRFTSTDFRVLNAQLVDQTSLREEFQSKYLQCEIQLLVKTQYIHELEQTLNERNKSLVKVQTQLDNAKRKILALRKQIRQTK